MSKPEGAPRERPTYESILARNERIQKIFEELDNLDTEAVRSGVITQDIYAHQVQLSTLMKSVYQNMWSKNIKSLDTALAQLKSNPLSTQAIKRYEDMVSAVNALLDDLEETPTFVAAATKVLIRQKKVKKGWN